MPWHLKQAILWLAGKGVQPRLDEATTNLLARIQAGLPLLSAQQSFGEDLPGWPYQHALHEGGELLCCFYIGIQAVQGLLDRLQLPQRLIPELANFR